MIYYDSFDQFMSKLHVRSCSNYVLSALKEAMCHTVGTKLESKVKGMFDEACKLSDELDQVRTVSESDIGLDKLFDIQRDLFHLMRDSGMRFISYDSSPQEWFS